MNNTFPVSEKKQSLSAEHSQVVTPRGYYGALSDTDDSNDEIDLRELLAVLRRRKGTIFLIALLTFVAALIITFMMKPIYRASTTLQINSEATKVLSYDVEAESRSVNAKDFYQTQFEILKSRSLAKRTIEGMGLESTLRGDQLAKPFYEDTIIGLKSLFTSDVGKDGDELSVESSVGQFPLENRFIENLVVSPVKNSQIVKLSYDSTDPQLATNIINTVAANYIEMNLERRVDAASFAKDFLNRQLSDVKSRLEESQVKLNEYAKKNDLFKAGDENIPSLTASKISALSVALNKAETARIVAQSDYENSQQAKGAAKVLDSPTVQALKRSLVGLQSEYQEKLQIYKPGYPLMVQLKRQMNKIESEISTEIREIRTTIEKSMRSEYLAAQESESQLRSELEKQKGNLVNIRDKDIGYNTLLREVETNRSSYDGLLTRLKEVSVAGGVESNNISILDTAIVPYSKHKPNTKLNLALGAILGVFLGVVVAFLVEFLDDRVKTTEELERLLGMPLLGLTPSVKAVDATEHALYTLEQPASALAESFRSLRTNLLFASREGIPKVLTLTSAMPSEGKSSSCLNLATAFAQANSRVLLIDADLRKPTAHKRMKLDNSKGLSDYLTYQADIDSVIQESLVKGVSVITAGTLSPNPSELLSSDRLLELFALAPDTFDIIIVDAPPVMGLADALVLANKASATLMVTAFAQSKKRQIQDAHKRLRQANANLIGVLFTKVKSGGSYGYSYDYQYYYSYGNDKLEKS